ncbi:MAG TPA: DUF2155 domain-containing protein [Sphingomicrobium sp.]|nr:DUF2155 domain-containing protein [Sphingomicrobium sp.]
MRRRAVIALALALAVAGCRGEEKDRQATADRSANRVLTGHEAGVTPMAQRVAVLGLLNKRNGIVKNLTMKPGQAVRVKDVIVRLKACETTAPWEPEDLTGAFVQLDVQGSDERWRRVFSGWLYKESPSLNVVEHPVYDVWPRSCAMTFPAGPPAPPPPRASSSRSSARKSGSTNAPEAAEPATPSEAVSPPPSAAVSNAA